MGLVSKKYLYNTYITIESQEHSKQIQKRVFGLGGFWQSGVNRIMTYPAIAWIIHQLP